MSFILYPAIDLIDGKCVRLHKGDFNQVTTYGDPLEMAKQFENDGATWLHMVDLDGAKSPENRQIDLIKTIVKSTRLKVQTGGGIRSLEDVENLLKVGVSRVVIGSMAITNSEGAEAIINSVGADKITLALDVFEEDDGDFYVATSGWQVKTNHPLDSIIKQYQPLGIKHILCTDIGRDGTMTGPNSQLYGRLASDYPDLDIQASGGVHEVEDLPKLEANNVAGAIVGKAIYEGKINVADALKALASPAKADEVEAC